MELTKRSDVDREAYFLKIATENVILEAAIRKHRDQRGDDRCWMDDEGLYKTLPGGYTPPARDTCVMLNHCERFIANRHNPATAYVSPEREIERLNRLIADAAKELEEIVCVLEPDRGIVLLSADGPTHYDADLKCQVYECEHFSPLGDALIALHDKLAGK